MVEFLFLKAHDARLKYYAAAMRELIELESRKLGMANPAAYFAADNDFVLACENGRLLGMTVVKQHRLRHLTYLGFRLVITHPDAARRGIFAKMVTLYFLRCLPGFLWQKLRRPGHEICVYGDFATPIIYAKLTKLGMKMYPDLVHGDTPAEIQTGRRLRATLVEQCGIRDMWQCPGVVREVCLESGAIRDCSLGPTSPAQAQAQAHARHDDGGQEAIDRDWAVRWNEYVPPGADLLCIMPLNAFRMAARIIMVLRFGFKRSRPRQPRPNTMLIRTSA